MLESALPQADLSSICCNCEEEVREFFADPFDKVFFKQYH
jgi:hypothetical protein